MSGKLDQSLDEIMKDRRATAPRRGRNHKATAGRPRTTAPPVGGIAKTARAAKPMTRAAAPSGPSNGESKIIVSNMPEDVSENQIKDYFGKTIGPVKRVHLTYGPNGRSRGISTIIFLKPGSAAEAAKTLDGVKVDNRAMRIEVVIGARDAPAPPTVKTFADRVAHPKKDAKSQPRPVTAAKPTVNGRGAARERGGKGGAKGRNAGRPKPKTAVELDAEMQDYFGDGTNGAVTNGDAAPAVNGVTTSAAAAAPAANGDTGMEDELM